MLRIFAFRLIALLTEAPPDTAAGHFPHASSLHKSNGVVKWISHDRVVLAMNDRRAYADTFWFLLFHEIKHVLQQKTKTIFVSSSSQEMRIMDARLEKEADDFAQNYLIPVKDYRRFAPNKYTSDAQIIAFAKSIGIHPGVVAGRLQHDGIIAPNRCSGLRQKYKIIIQ